jgi:hypothetical protein
MRILRGLCINYVVDGRFAQARERIAPMLAAIEASEDPARPGDFYLSARWVSDMMLYASDELGTVLEHVGQTRELAMRVNNRTARCASAALLAQTHCLRGEYVQAKTFADEGLALGEEIGNMNVFPATASVALIARVELGETFDPAHYVDCIEKGLAAAGFMQLNIRYVVEALMAIDDVPRAQQHAESLNAVVGGRLRQALVGVAMGDVMQRVGRLDRARAAYEQALAVATEIGARSSIVGAVLGLAEVAVARGETPDARALDRAQRLCDELRLGRYADRLARAAAPTPLALASS